jgi:hypothetical protein
MVFSRCWHLLLRVLPINFFLLALYLPLCTQEPDEVVIFRDGKYLTLKEVGEAMHRKRDGAMNNKWSMCTVSIRYPAINSSSELQAHATLLSVCQHITCIARSSNAGSSQSVYIWLPTLLAAAVVGD